MNKRHLYFGLISSGLVVMVFLAWIMFLKPASVTVEKGALAIPETLGGVSRIQLVTGPEAIRQISGLHGKAIEFSEGYIAVYEGGGKSLTLWISVSPSEESGKTLFEQMDVKMPQSKVFTNRQELDIQGEKVIKVLGMGQEHYYWLKGTKNYWVAVGGTDAIPIVAEVISQF